MVDRLKALSEAKDLAEFCAGQFCPDCVFNTGTCAIGEIGWTPKNWNTSNALDKLEEMENNDER